MPDALDDSLGALVAPMAVGVHAMRWLKPEPGASMAILGCGTIGLCSLLAARSLGCERVFITARHPFQAAAAERLGATAVLPIEPAAAAEAVKDLTRGRGVDYVVEAVGGAADTLALALQLARRQGKIAVLGIFTGGPMPVDIGLATSKEATIIFPNCYNVSDGRHDFEVAIDVISKQPSAVRSLVTHEFPLGETDRAFATAADKTSGSIKVQVRP